MAEKTLWQKMISEFNTWESSNSTIRSFWKKIEAEKADYEDAQEFAKIIAGKWSDLLKKYVGAEVDISNIPNSEVLEAIERTMERSYKGSSYYASKVQELINKSVKINIKAVEGQIEQSRIENLLTKLRAGDDVTDILITTENEWLIEEHVVENISRSAVTDTIEANAKLHTEAGLVSYIERRQGTGGCCEWCASVAGRYVYGEQPKDFFKVHKHCNCVITYMPSRSKWKEITYKTNSKGNRSKITTEL